VSDEAQGMFQRSEMLSNMVLPFNSSQGRALMVHSEENVPVAKKFLN
jgi:hypothetical protein